MRHAVLAVVVASACADPTLDMALYVRPGDDAVFDASCVRSVEVRALGKLHSSTRQDFTRVCVPIPEGARTLLDIRDAVRGKVVFERPESGLQAVQVFGTTKDTCVEVSPDENDMLFYANAPFAGEGSLVVPLIPNQSCARQQLAIRPVDLLGLVTSSRCDASYLTSGEVSLATLTPDPFTERPVLSAGGVRAKIQNGVAALLGPTVIGAQTCLTMFSANESMVSVACRQNATTCARPGELEAPVVDYGVIERSRDEALSRQYGVIIGAVYGASGPVRRATVQVADPDVKVRYLDVPLGFDPLADTPLVNRDTGGTGPSGLFMVYTNKFTDLAIYGPDNVLHNVSIPTTQDEFPGEWRYFQRLKPTALIVRL